jgi:hypothetical protein
MPLTCTIGGVSTGLTTRRRWYQFSLGTMLIVTTTIALTTIALRDELRRMMPWADPDRDFIEALEAVESIPLVFDDTRPFVPFITPEQWQRLTRDRYQTARPPSTH